MTERAYAFRFSFGFVQFGYMSLRRNPHSLIKWRIVSSGFEQISSYVVPGRSCSRMCLQPLHSVIMCLIDSGVLHTSQRGRSFFSIRYECVNLVCPIRILQSAICSLLVRDGLQIFWPISGLIIDKKSVEPSHILCHKVLKYSFAMGMKSVNGTLKGLISLANQASRKLICLLQG